MLDPRLTLARDGIAARALEGIVPAERYVDTILRQARLPAAALRRAPSPEAEQLDQLLFGELFEVLAEADGWAFGQARRDGYVGYVASEALGAPGAAPTHTVRALRTYGFSAPSIKAAPIGLYSMNTPVAEEGREGRFVKTAGGWIVEEHLAALGDDAPDYVAVAERLVGTPYQWGGRESLGLDCSGLVQQALYAAGRASPRDSDQQAAMGEPVEGTALRRGDLVFWRGHVAMLTSPTDIVHANSTHMAVVIEPLAEAVTRTANRGGGEPTGYRRI
ncbi:MULTISPECIES: NlpC/P60 family protein [unclassified Devosia]|uniref:C40 family peptidase n=1 Tax=unclassified Devosia TaxID=196773 RepID=UPI00086C50F2|nr:MULTISPECIES: NlpC/P60 family protein [unclassified Devosia]MBN9360616.1 C40 family peptidase [Devosia sp.]ODS85495.1 MAG: hydrolase Nlp/P60 [Devosia sp. SCN 66-27]OJX22595.1 MAG: hydrolase Nlp/P60 [Devosia sp. 66-14]